MHFTAPLLAVAPDIATDEYYVFALNKVFDFDLI
jgi:hypothetical protein